MVSDVAQHLFTYNPERFHTEFLVIRKLLVHRENLAIWLDKLAYNHYLWRFAVQVGLREQKGRETIKCWEFPVYLSESLPENTFIIERINNEHNN